jgi:hypothetical protein
MDLYTFNSVINSVSIRPRKTVTELFLMLWTNTRVNLIVKGTKQSAQTDLDGKYSVQAKAGDVYSSSMHE